MKIKAGEWLAMGSMRRYLEIKRAFIKTQLKNKKAAS